MESRRLWAAAGGVAAKRSSWGTHGAKARISLATSPERMAGDLSSPLLMSTHFVPITFLPRARACARGTFS